MAGGRHETAGHAISAIEAQREDTGAQLALSSLSFFFNLGPQPMDIQSGSVKPLWKHPNRHTSVSLR